MFALILISVVVSNLVNLGGKEFSHEVSHNLGNIFVKLIEKPVTVVKNSIFEFR